MEQRSQEWYDARLGRFTASEAYKLMGIKGLGKTGESYAFENAVEMAFGSDEEDNFTSFDMQKGVDLEPVAFEKFKELKELEFLRVKTSEFVKIGENAGASPDGEVSDNSVLEIKCPKPNKFFNLVRVGESAIDKMYNYQMQMQMHATNSNQCYFFNYIIFNGVPMWHEIIVKYDAELIVKILDRIEEAVVLRNQYTQELLTNKQF